jgi:hypothetical protein
MRVGMTSTLCSESALAESETQQSLLPRRARIESSSLWISTLLIYVHIRHRVVLAVVGTEDPSRQLWIVEPGRVRIHE